MKKAILVVSFGTTYENSLKNSIEALENDIRASFPEYDVFRAFTSSIVIKRLNERGISTDSVSEALEKLASNGYSSVTVQPTHIINGIEYEKMCSVCETFSSRFSHICTGVPLFNSESDMEYVCQFFKNEFGTDSAAAFMGHGTEHAANQLYSDFRTVCSKHGYNNMFTATVEGTPDINDLVSELKESAFRNVIITPLMLVAGDHACNDMAGNDDDSWLSILSSEGFSVTPVIKGLGEYAEIRRLYVSHLENTIKSFE